jgi:MYXO-CTERM domain-containing protein
MRGMTDPQHQPFPPGPNPRDEQAHDVLAAEEFAMPGPEEGRAGGPVALPTDPSGQQAPHDILAAEEFAMPAARHGLEVSDPPAPARSTSTRVLPLLGALGLGAVALLRRRRAKRA